MSSLTAGASTAAWWANTRRSSRGSLVGAVALVFALAIVSSIVWMSPATSPVSAVTTVVTTVEAQNRLVSERNTLRAQAAELRVETAQLKTQLAIMQSHSSGSATKLAAATAELASLSQQIGVLTSQLDAANSKIAAMSPKTKVKPKVVTPTATLITAPTKAQIMDPSSPYFGLYTAQAPFNWATFDQTATEVGSQPGAVGFFVGWDQNYRASAVTAAWSRGILPVMTWESRPINAPNSQSVNPDYTLSKIINGSFDSYLSQFAQSVVSTGLPVVIRLDHEMNGNWYPWSEVTNTNSTGQYAQMWQHVWNVFQQNGANSLVIWDWSPNRIDRLAKEYQPLAYTQSLYPGDQYVDWVGMSGYLRGPVTASTDLTFTGTFGATLAQLKEIAPTKKIFLSEVGATETGGKKPIWITNFFQGLNDPANSDIVGFAWFSLVVTSFAEGDTATNDWRLDSTRQSLAAFVAGFTTPGGRFVVRPPS